MQTRRQQRASRSHRACVPRYTRDVRAVQCNPSTERAAPAHPQRRTYVWRNREAHDDADADAYFHVVGHVPSNKPLERTHEHHVGGAGGWVMSVSAHAPPHTVSRASGAATVVPAHWVRCFCYYYCQTLWVRQAM